MTDEALKERVDVARKWLADPLGSRAENLFAPDVIALFSRLAAVEAERNSALTLATERFEQLRNAEAERDTLEAMRREEPNTVVLQAVLDAIKGTLDPHTQIADHPNVKFAQSQHLKVFQAGWDAGFQEALTPDVFPWANRCLDAYQAYQASQTDLERR